MLMHYLSHPFSGDEEKNRAAAEAIQRELQERYPKTLYINPIAQFKALAGMEYDTIMGYCLELLDREYHIPVFFYDAEKHEYVREEGVSGADR